jgi:hypothetical protein
MRSPCAGAFLTACTFVATPLLAQPCPTNSAGDRAFNFDQDARFCVFGPAVHGNPGHRTEVARDVYCPQRMTAASASRVGRALVAGELNIGENRLRAAFDRLGLAPTYVGTPHVFHYRCTSEGRPGVATHIRVVARAWPTVEQIAAQCTVVNQAGAVRPDTRMSREYNCRIHLRHDERGMAEEVARILMRNDRRMLEDARAVSGRVCLQPTTDIQCAPCHTSDKLVMRYITVRQERHCPAGTLDWIF